MRKIQIELYSILSNKYLLPINYNNGINFIYFKFYSTNEDKLSNLYNLVSFSIFRTLKNKYEKDNFSTTV